MTPFLRNASNPADLFFGAVEFPSKELHKTQEAMENSVFPDEIKTKFMEANCFVKNASLLTFDILKIFKQRFTFTRNGVKATQLTLLVAS